MVYYCGEIKRVCGICVFAGVDGLYFNLCVGFEFFKNTVVPTTRSMNNQFYSSMCPLGRVCLSRGALLLP
jgi:hypothetical protein